MDSSLAFGQTFILKHLLLDGINVDGQLLGLRLTVVLNISYSMG
jgi:hypothetical protein